MSTIDGTDLTQLTATELLDLYRERATSPVEATQAVLERIDALNPTLNAFCLVDADSALASARASEARWQRGEPMGALDGVPTSIKDLILTRGLADATRVASPSTPTSRGTSTRQRPLGFGRQARSSSARPRRPSSAARERPTRR